MSRRLNELLDCIETSTQKYTRGARTYADHATCRAVAVALFLKREGEAAASLDCTTSTLEPVAVSETTKERDEAAIAGFLKFRKAPKTGVDTSRPTESWAIYLEADVKAAIEFGMSTARQMEGENATCPKWVECSWKSGGTKPAEPQPVAVEDITPGWYWNIMAMQDGGLSTVLTHVSCYNGNLRTFDNTSDGHNQPLARASDKISWYHAPSPEELMAMCREQKPQLCVDCTQITPHGEPCPFRGRRTDPRLCGYRCPMFQEKTEPSPNTRPCGECGNWESGSVPSWAKALKMPWGSCKKAGFVNCRMELMPHCQSFTEKPIEHCGDCRFFTDPPERCSVNKAPVHPGNTWAVECPHATPKK